MDSFMTHQEKHHFFHFTLVFFTVFSKFLVHKSWMIVDIITSWRVVLVSMKFIPNEYFPQQNAPTMAKLAIFIESWLSQPCPPLCLKDQATVFTASWFRVAPNCWVHIMKHEQKKLKPFDSAGWLRSIHTISLEPRLIIPFPIFNRNNR